MSIQNGEGIEFAVSPEENYETFRLLELPPEVVPLLTSENPITLSLKESKASPAAPSSAVLCTKDKTYHIRQVNTSNSLFVTKLNDSTTSSDDGLPRVRLEAVAKALSVLEAVPSGPINYEEVLKAAVPALTSTGFAATSDTQSKSEIFRHLPFSDDECERAWTSLACFDHEDPPRSFVPSDDVRWKVWQTLKTNADADGLDLTSPLSDADRTLMASEIDDWPTELVAAVLKSVCSTWTEAGFQIDGDKCSQFIGRGVLREVTRDEVSVATAHFMESWKTQLPRAWEHLTAIDLLAPHYRLENEGKQIALKKDPSHSRESEIESGTTSKAGAKRKWHTKFRPSKKAS